MLALASGNALDGFSKEQDAALGVPSYVVVEAMVWAGWPA
jgi:hypothetical protein